MVAFAASTGIVTPCNNRIHRLCARTAPRRPASATRRPVTAACAEASSPAELLQSDDYVERIRGVNRSSEVSDPHARVALLLPLVTSDPASQVRFCALSHLSAIGAANLTESELSATLEAARAVLRDDKEASCRSGAADVIAGLRLKDGFSDLVDAFNADDDWMTRFSIVAGMGELAHPDAFEFLSGIVEDEESAEGLILTAAVGALGDLGDERGVALIKKFVENEDASVSERAKIALDMLEKKD